MTESIRWFDESVAVCRVPHVRVLRVKGDDALSWLNSVTTQDLRKPSPGVARPALFTDARGRVRADAVVLFREAHVDVLIPSQGADELVEALDSRIVMEDAELSLPDVVALSAQGPKAQEIELMGRGFAHDRLGAGGFDLLVDAEDAASTEAGLVRAAEQHGGGAVDTETWALAHLRRGRPRFGVDFGNDTYPQEAGLETTHVSFEKGCYVGQEAIHMLQVRGKPPRRLVRLQVGDASSLPADALVKDAAGARVGQVTSWAAGECGGLIALAMLRRTAAESSEALAIEGAAATRLGLAGC